MDVLAADITPGRRGWGARVRRRWWVIGLAVLLSAWGIQHYLSVRAPQYVSTSSVSIRLPAQVTAQPQLAQVAMDDELQWAQSLPVAARVDSLLGLDVDPTVVQRRVTVAQPPGAQLITFTYTGSSVAGAHDGAGAFAEAFVDVRGWPREDGQSRRVLELEAQLAQTQAALGRYTATLGVVPSTDPRHEEALEQVAILGGEASTINSEVANVDDESTPVAAVVGNATVPTGPSGLPPALVAVAGLLLGLLGGLAVAVLLAWRDRRLHRASDVTTWADLPLLGEIPRVRRARRPLGVAEDRAARIGVDRLRRQVLRALGPTGRGVVAVTTSGVSSAGSFTAMNLVTAAARRGTPAVLVCADPASPTPAVLGSSLSAGLSEVLQRRVGAEPVRSTYQQLAGGWLIGPGAGLDDVLRDAPGAGLGSFLQWLVDEGFLVVVEAPPATPGVIGLEVARLAGVTVLVAETSVTRIPDLRRAAGELELAGAHLLGVLSVCRLDASDAHAPDPAGYAPTVLA